MSNTEPKNTPTIHFVKCDCDITIRVNLNPVSAGQLWVESQLSCPICKKNYQIIPFLIEQPDHRKLIRDLDAITKTLVMGLMPTLEDELMNYAD